jgi:hypothetical protein
MGSPVGNRRGSLLRGCVELGMRFRPHFTVRDLFWLTIVVAMAVGWWLDVLSVPWKVVNTIQGVKIQNQYTGETVILRPDGGIIHNPPRNAP